MNPTSKKLISLFLVFSLMLLSVNLYAEERRGAELIITKKDGQQIRGELITVKSNSLLLLNAEGKDVSVDIADIEVIRIVKKSKALLGAGAGLVILGGIGVLISLISGWEDEEGGKWMPAILCGSVGASYGLSTGAIIGAVAGIDKKIQIEGMSDAEIQETLNKLSKKGRIRDYR